MKFQFIYPNMESKKGDFQLGIASLSAVLKEDGHKVDLIHLKAIDKERYIEKILRDGRRYKPDIVGLSVTELDAKYLKKIAEVIKKEFGTPIIVGGSYATLAPDETISIPEVDYVARGEAEYPLRTLVNNLEDGKNVDGIKGIWIKKGNKIVKNELDNPPDIDSLPFPDRSIFDKENIVGHEFGGTSEYCDVKKIGMMCSRGCPFNCTYCINVHVKNLYPDRGRYVRFRSVDQVIEEITELQSMYSFGSIGFYDDTMLLNKKWIGEFAEKYKKEINLPFYANARPETCKRELVPKIHDAGCKRLQIGIESGSEKIRSDVLKRYNTNEQIIDAFKLAKEHGLETYSLNMVGLPYETADDIKRTIRLNAEIRPDVIQVSVFYPFHGTKLGELCHEKGWVVQNKDEIDSFFEETILTYPQLSKKQIDHFYRNFDLYYSIYGRSIPRLLKCIVIRGLKRAHLFDKVRPIYKKVKSGV